MPDPYKAANKTERQYDHAVYRTYERFTRNHPRYTGDGLCRYDRNPGKGHPADAGRARYDRQSPHGHRQDCGVRHSHPVQGRSCQPQAAGRHFKPHAGAGPADRPGPAKSGAVSA